MSKRNDRQDTTVRALELSPQELLRSLCVAVATYHGGSIDPHNAQIKLNFRTVEDAAVAWQALGVMQDIAP